MFDNRVCNALGYAVILFLLPFFVAGDVRGGGSGDGTPDVFLRQS